MRWRVLRSPWGQPRGSERDEYENASAHRMLCDASNKVLAVGRLHRLDDQRAQIRFMAVADDYQHRGFGTVMLTALETVAREAGSREIILHARELSLPFYLRAGYQVVEKSHILFGAIEHFKMRKDIAG